MKLFEFKELTSDLNATIEWMKSKRLLSRDIQCEICNDDMKLSRNSKLNDRWIFRCSKQSCETMSSIRKGSFFSNSKMRLGDILILLHLWAKQYPQQLIYTDFDYAKQTVTDWARFCRDLCVMFFDNLHFHKIGAVGVTVEIDESVKVKRKYNRGRLLKTQWVLVGLSVQKWEKRNFLSNLLMIEQKLRF